MICCDNITLTAVGDISLGDSPKSLGFGVKNKIKHKGTHFIFEKVEDLLTGDIVFGNLETVLSEEGLIPYNFESEQLRGMPDCASVLKDVGFTVLNLANNHAMQHGIGAFAETVRVLSDNKIYSIGLRGKNRNGSLPKIVNVKGHHVGFLGYSLVADRYCCQNEIQYAYCVPPETIYADVKRLREKVDWVIVSIHRGPEFVSKPSPLSKDIGHNIIDAGADIVLGHHPHVLQGVEEYTGGIICYSLGNFVFDMVWNSATCTSMIIKFNLKKGEKITYDPVSIIINNHFQPMLCGDEKKINTLVHREAIPDYCGIDIEQVNLNYSREAIAMQRNDMVKSNLFFLLTFLTRTPIRFWSGKLKYFFKKFLLRSDLP